MDENDNQSIDSQEILPLDPQTSEFDFIHHDYPILNVEARVESEIWNIHDSQAPNTLNIQSIIRPEVISADNPSRTDIQVATWNINGG